MVTVPARVSGWTRVGRAAASVAVVVAIALLAGALTSVGQQYLPDAVRSIANSSGSWTLITFAAVYLSRTHGLAAAVLGAIAFVLMNEAYGIVSTWRGYPYIGGITNIWNVIGVIIGPIVGIAASWLRTEAPRQRAFAAAAPSAVLIGEGIYGLTVVSETTSPVYWWLEIVAGVLVVALIAVFRLRHRRYIVDAVVLTVMGAVLFAFLYTVVPRLLFGF